MPIPFTCPNCGRTGTLPDNFTGTMVRCPACHERTPIAATDDGTIPLVPEPVAPPPRPSMVPDLAAATPVRPGADTGSSRVEPEPFRPNVALIAGALGAVLGIVGGLIFFLTRDGKEGPSPRPQPPSAIAAVSETQTTESDQGEEAAVPVTLPRKFGLRPTLPAFPAPANPLLAGNPTAGNPAPVPAADGENASPANAPNPEGAEFRTVAAKAEGSQAETIKRIKDATVFLKVRAGQAQASGSGFVFQVDGDTVLIATNHHVVNPHLEGVGPTSETRLGRIKPSVTAVFRSGRGGTVEQSVPATVIASDRVGNHDLAILKVERVRNPPLPIDLAERVEPTETMPVMIFGFPFGHIDRMLNSATQGNPAITINKGSVSSLRMDEFNQLSYIQIDGSLNPGNSGGPVVDNQGRLVGVAVAQISNTTIGFAIPPAELTRMLEGQVGRLSLALRSEAAGKAEIQVEANVIDPKNRIKGVDLFYVSVSRANATTKPAPNADGTWSSLSGATKISLAFNPPIASAIFQLNLVGIAGRNVLLQTAYQDNAGKTIYGSPVSYTVPRRPTSMAPVGEPASDSAQPQKAKVELAFQRLGPLVDPVKNCKLDKTDTSVSIEVPAGVHVLSPELDARSSPMTLTEVQGDFIAHVKIEGNLLPGSDGPKYKGKTLPFTFQGAGLILWQDKSNYVRLERTASTKKGSVVLASEILLEIIKNDKIAGRAYIRVPDGPLYLRLFRLNGAIQGMYGPDGRRWVILKKLAVPLSDKVKVGLSASNASKEALSAKFEEFVLITDSKSVSEVEKD